MNRNFFIILFCLLLLNLALVHAQERHTYDSLYQPMIGYSGQAKFTYFINDDGDKLIDGPFEFESKVIDSTCGTYFNDVIWKGKYRKNQKTGDWEYWDIAHELVLKDIDQKYKVDYGLISKKEHVNGQFVDGVPNGEWEVVTEVLKDGKLTDSVLYLKTNINLSEFNGNIVVYGKSDDGREYAITGKTDKGLMVGEWVFTYFLDDQEVKETRIFDKGFLLSLIREDKTTGDTILNLTFPLSDEINAYLKGDNDFEVANLPLSFTYSDGYPRNSPLIIEQKPGNLLLEEAVNELFKFEPDFFDRHGLPLGTNRMLYRPTAEEKKVLEAWPELEYAFRDKIVQMEELGAANFNYRDNDTLQIIEEWIARQQYMIMYIKPWNHILAQDEIKYYNRKGKLFDYARELLAVDTLETGGKENVFSYHVPPREERSFLFYVSDNFSQRLVMADLLQQVYERIVKKLYLADKIMALEQKILEKKEVLDSLYAPGENPGSLHEQWKMAVRQEFLGQDFEEKNAVFLAYSGSDETQKAIGDSLLYTLNTLRKAHKNINSIFFRRTLIDSLYTEYVFDPYTFNDRFPKRIKKKLYQVAAEGLFEELIWKAKQSKSIPELLQSIHRLESLQERLVFLVDKDTRKLEKKLKSKLPIEEKLELLKIE